MWLVGDREEHLGGKWEMEGAHSGGKRDMEGAHESFKWKMEGHTGVVSGRWRGTLWW